MYIYVSPKRTPRLRAYSISCPGEGDAIWKQAKYIHTHTSTCSQPFSRPHSSCLGFFDIKFSFNTSKYPLPFRELSMRFEKDTVRKNLRKFGLTVNSFRIFLMSMFYIHCGTCILIYVYKGVCVKIKEC